jgi:hypothetical protein
LLFGIAWFAKSSGTWYMRSISSLRNASQRGCTSSMTETSIAPDHRQALALLLRRSSWRACVAGGGSPSKYSSRKLGLAPSTIFEERFQKVSGRAGPDGMRADVVAVVLDDLARQAQRCGNRRSR